ncbi:MAG: radical SAM protein, partial [bacterium]
MFVRGKIDNSSDWEVNSWIQRLQELLPLWVQIYSLDRDTASDGLLKVEPGRLQEIADMAEKMTGLRVDIF